MAGVLIAVIFTTHDIVGDLSLAIQKTLSRVLVAAMFYGTFAVISVALLYKTTKNYVKQRGQWREEPEEDRDTDDDWDNDNAPDGT